MSAATPTPLDSGLPPPPSAPQTSPPHPIPEPTSTPSSAPATTIPPKPIILHLGDDIRWNHELYASLQSKFQIERSYSLGREEFKQGLREGRWGDFVGMYRPFWNTGGEMGNWDEELISLLPKSCKIYASAGAGFDWVDTKTMAEHGVIYCNSAPSCTESVADAAIFLIISTFRAMAWSFLAARSCSQSQFENANQNIAAQTHNPNNHILGIVGLGKIGYRIAQKASTAFEMKIWYHDIFRFEEREKDVGAKWCPTLEELLEGSDCVILATPFSGAVLLSTKQFGLFKRGSRLVNIARGKLIDEDALNVALDEGIISAAGLDVHANEPLVNEKLAKRENVMVLSHTAGASVESHIGFERLGMENLIEFFDGRGAITPVNMQWLKKEE
ncbi:D-mandelate dehydrogenase-like protein [Lindgomyces ingoldianus]|uniref:D-mandelate dehydrogenase-like protein n=1 Tax=Lindgomyces ingoldianus TaxID=673940 RepID=A0ACB6QEL6_9PLEO|nr:D-mandelate dehydrogenase-like protein [Lindgomyces ingoldianus]KAF2465361.1 D-mandelate dehydrogenase-like protein [Lindgomyces ingoldianus]